MELQGTDADLQLALSADIDDAITLLNGLRGLLGQGEP